MELMGRHYRTGERVLVRVAEQRIQSVEPTHDGKGMALSGRNLWLAPALIDIQVNGFGGVDLNEDRATADGVAAVVEKMWATGVAMLCPTVVTGSRERMVASLKAIAAACARAEVARSIPAIHVEGPFLSPEDGPRGAHPREHVRPPDWEEFRRMQEAAQGRIGMVTLAPETRGAVELIEKLVGEEIIPAIGHTAASREEIQAAVRAGAKISTHLGNGAHAVLPRHPNYIWEQLAADELWASLIVDGHHLPPPVVKCMIRAKGIQRCILTSDAIAVAGLPPGRYHYADMDVEVTSAFRVGLPGTPLLMGSALELRRGVENAVRFAGISLTEAITMAALHPAQLLGIADEVGDLVAGQRANLILFEWAKGVMNLLATVVDGQVRYRADSLS